MKPLLIATGFILAATSAALARDYGYQGYDYQGYGYEGSPEGYGVYDSYGSGFGARLYDDTNAPGGAYIAGSPYGGGPVRQRPDSW